MFSICKQTVPANGIEFAIKCKFFNSLEENLVVGGSNVLKVFRLIPEVELNSKEKYTGESSASSRLILMNQFFQMFGLQTCEWNA